MVKKTDIISENKTNIRKNRRKIFELDAEVSTTYAELMLLLADIEENRSLLQRNFTSAFMGNRSIAIDNVNDLYGCRMAMLEACLLYTSPSPRDTALSRMPSSA